ncbi:MAG TPA: S8 family peptidase [Rhodocyclaceae bacterium]|nr:S8 family peptidase [Rhodocyclaceae bacterium]
MRSRSAGSAPKAALVVAFSAFLTAACGGGGGGGGGAAALPAQTPTATSTRTPVAVSEGEISRSAYINQTGAQTAWRQGYAGKGVTVAILDSGVTADLAEFSGRIHADSGNYTDDGHGNVTKTQPVTDDQGHGTWVASVLGAGANDQKTVGIAPEATLLALGFYGQADMTGSTSMLIDVDRLTSAFAQSRTSGAAVVSGSFSISSDLAALRSSLQQSVRAGQVLVFAAGNDGQANPGLPARYAKESWANGQIIAVGAVDSNNRITDYSNRAGDVMQFYLVAPGSVAAVDKNGSVVNVMGTSFSAPQVAGAAALVKQKWPQLSGGQVASILFTTATDLGDPGVDPIYGRGLLNIDKAMQPIGQTSIATPNGASVPVGASGLALPAGGIASSIVRAASRGAFTVAATDTYGRDFKTDLAPRITRDGGSLESDLQQSMARAIHGVDRSFGNLRFSFMPMVQGGGDRPIVTTRSFFGYGENDSWQFGGGSTDRLDHFFGLDNREGGSAHPYFQFAREGQFAGAGFALSDYARMRAGTLASASATGLVVDFAYSSRSRLQPRPEAGDWALALTAGGLAERAAVLGMTGTGALAPAPGRSSFTTLGGRYWLDGNTEIGGNFTLGRTESADSGLLRFSPLVLWSAEALVARSDNWLRGDHFTLTVGRPMAVVSGSLGLVLPARVSDDGRLGFQESRINLGSSSGETRLGFGYSAPVNKTGKVVAKGIYRFNADNDPGRREGIFGLQFHQPF